MKILYITLTSLLLVSSVSNVYAAPVTDDHGLTLDQWSGSLSAPTGMKITAKACSESGYTLDTITKDSDVNATRAILHSDAHATLSSVSFSGSTATFDYTITGSTTYYVLVDNSGASYTRWSRSTTYPHNDTNINWIAGYNGEIGDVTTEAYSVQTVTTDCSAATSSTSTSSLDIIMENFYNFAFIILAGVFFFVVAWWWYKMLK